MLKLCGNCSYLDIHYTEECYQSDFVICAGNFVDDVNQESTEVYKVARCKNLDGPPIYLKAVNFKGLRIPEVSEDCPLLKNK